MFVLIIFFLIKTNILLGQGMAYSTLDNQNNSWHVDIIPEVFLANT